MVLEKTLESPLDCKEIKPVSPKGNQSWIFIGRTDAEAETPILWPPDVKYWLIGKDPDAGKDWRQEEWRTGKDEMVGWHHRLHGREFEQARELVMDREAWHVAVYGVAKSWIQLSDWTELNCSVISDSFGTLWIAAHQAPLFCSPFLGCPRQECGVDFHFLLQGIFLTQWSNLSLLRWEVDYLPLSHEGCPSILWLWAAPVCWELWTTTSLTMLLTTCQEIWGHGKKVLRTPKGHCDLGHMSQAHVKTLGVFP